MTIHSFTSSGDAYDACQTSDDIRTGDVILIAAEQIVGIADTWPFAVTAHAGNLHSLAPTARLDFLKPITAAHLAAALSIARANHWPVCPVATAAE